MQQYWVYLWALQYGAYRDTETLVTASDAGRALLLAMQHHNVDLACDAYVVLNGATSGQAFKDVPFPVQEQAS